METKPCLIEVRRVVPGAAPMSGELIRRAAYDHATHRGRVFVAKTSLWAISNGACVYTRALAPDEPVEEYDNRLD